MSLRRAVVSLLSFMIIFSLVVPVFAQGPDEDDQEVDCLSPFTIGGQRLPDSVNVELFADGEMVENLGEIFGGNFILGDPGVLAADDYDEAEANPSAVYTPNYQDLLTDPDESYLPLPEGGYGMSTAAGQRIEYNDVSITLHPCEDQTTFFLARGIVADEEDSEDQNVQLRYTEYNPGFILYTRFPVPRNAGGWFSEDYLIDNVNQAHDFENCGESGCTRVIVFLLDTNNGAYAVLAHTEDDGWILLDTNIYVDGVSLLEMQDAEVN